MKGWYFPLSLVESLYNALATKLVLQMSLGMTICLITTSLTSYFEIKHNSFGHTCALEHSNLFYNNIVVGNQSYFLNNISMPLLLSCLHSMNDGSMTSKGLAKNEHTFPPAVYLVATTVHLTLSDHQIQNIRLSISLGSNVSSTESLLKTYCLNCEKGLDVD